MTEDEWLTSTDPRPMFELVWNPHPNRRRASDRQYRLFACACARLLWDRLDDERSRRSVEVAEEFADGRAVADDLRSAHEAAIRVTADWPAFFEKDLRSVGAATVASTRVAFAAGRQAGVFLEEAMPGVGAVLARDVVGNPFRLVTIDPAWLSSTVTFLAQAIYADRAFDRMPILADALQDAGCESDAVLNHLRGSTPHVVGCWALDLVLGKR